MLLYCNWTWKKYKTCKYIFYASGGSNVSKDGDYLNGKAGWKFAAEAIEKVVVLHRFEVRKGKIL